MRVIPTRYADYYFRSRLEARYAVFFDVMREPWQYEREGYVLSNGDRYLPDFWLPEMSLHLEVKGQPPTEEEYAKAAGLRDVTGFAVAIFYGLPGDNWGWLYCWDQTEASGGAGEWQVRVGDNAEQRLALLVDGFDPERRELYAKEFQTTLRTSSRWMGSVAIEHAAARAKAERFDGQPEDTAILSAKIEALEQKIAYALGVTR